MTKYPPPSPSDVLNSLKDYDGDRHHLVLSKTRLAPVASERRATMAVCRYFGHSFPRIARAFKRDHTTVITACNKFNNGQRSKKHARSETELALFQTLRRRARAKVRARYPNGIEQVRV